MAVGEHQRRVGLQHGRGGHVEHAAEAAFAHSGKHVPDQLDGAPPPARGAPASHCSTVKPSGSPPGGPPVLITTISGAAEVLLDALQESGDALEVQRVVHVGAGHRSRPAASSRRSRPRALMATRAPSAASSEAIASPMPCEAPVTSATLPLSPRSIAASVLPAACRVVSDAGPAHPAPHRALLRGRACRGRVAAAQARRAHAAAAAAGAAGARAVIRAGGSEAPRGHARVRRRASRSRSSRSSTTYSKQGAESPEPGTPGRSSLGRSAWMYPFNSNCRVLVVPTARSGGPNCGLDGRRGESRERYA